MLSWFRNLFARAYAARIDPPVYAMTSELAASIAADLEAKQWGGRVFITTGTPSMVPLIPAAPSYVAIRPTICDDRILGRVCIYRADWSKLGPPCHRIVGKFPFGHGYIGSGDNNAHSEPQTPVTSANLLGEVIGVWTFPSTVSQPAKT